MSRNDLSLTAQLELAEWLKKNEPTPGMSLEDVKNKAQEALTFPMTVANVKHVMMALGMNTDLRVKKEVSDIVTLIELVHGLYQATAINTPPALAALLRKYRL